MRAGAGMVRNGENQKRWRQAQPVGKLVGAWGCGGSGLEQCAHDFLNHTNVDSDAHMRFLRNQVFVAEIGLS